jgi:hypothetical protein
MEASLSMIPTTEILHLLSNRQLHNSTTSYTLLNCTFLRNVMVTSKMDYTNYHYNVAMWKNFNWEPIIVHSVQQKSSEFVVEDCHGQSLLAVKYCLGVQNNTWIVKVLKEDHTLTYWFSMLRELLTELNCSCWNICITSIANRAIVCQ